MTKAEIRADERRKIYERLSAYTGEYVEKWARVVGHDQAKSDAWNILVAAKRCTTTDESTHQLSEDV